MPILTLASLAPRELRRRLRGPGVALALEPFVVRVASPYADVAAGLARHYGGRALDESGFADFHLRVTPTGPIRRFLRPRCRFSLDGEVPFKPLPADQAYCALEWGLNWAVAHRAHDYLIIHAAVLARGDDALVIPGPPGSGKTTLTAALMLRGWRLLSDELTLLDAERAIVPLVRPLNLKNDSIERIRARGGELGPVVRGTVKGAVCHLAPSAASLSARTRSARLRWVVVPRLGAPGTGPELVALTRAEAVLALLQNSFNANVLGAEGFARLTDALDGATAFELGYHGLDGPLEVLESALAGRSEGEATAWPTP